MISFPERKLERTIVMKETFINRNLNHKIEAKFAEASMHGVVPFSTNVLSMKIHRCVNVYLKIGFKPMYRLPLGVGNMLKECIVLVISDENRTNISMRRANRTKERFRAVNRMVLLTVINFLKFYSENTPANV